MPAVSVEFYTKEEVGRIIASVRKRDGDRCVIHGTLGAEVHELLQKSSSRKRSKDVFQVKYMACVCNDCHTSVHHRGKKKEVNKKILQALHYRYGYDYTSKSDKKFLERILTPTLKERRDRLA